MRVDALARAYGDVQLATLTPSPPTTGTWTYELKYDGYRILAVKSGDDVRLVSRRHQDWTSAFREIADDVAKLGVPACVLDGELCAIDPEGRPSFQLLQNRGRGSVRLAYFVFDVLYDGADLRGEPLETRREHLARILDPRLAASRIELSKPLAGDPVKLLRRACEAGQEGLIAKQEGSLYTSSRSRAWLKLKCTNRQEFAIVGWLPLKNGHPGIGSLVLGLMHDDGRFHFAGKVGTGFDNATRTSLWTRLRAHEASVATAHDVPRFGGRVHFVSPKLVAEIAFTEWTSGGHARHPSFQGLRADKRPADCVRERPRAAQSPPKRRPASVDTHGAKK